MQVHDIAVQDDGKIVVAGETETFPGGLTQFSLVRLLPNGRLDPGFGNGGTVTIEPRLSDGTAEAVAVQPDGKIVAVGWTNTRIALARLTTDGRLDATFGAGGKVLNKGQPTFYDIAATVVIQPDGKIVTGGWRQGSAVRAPAFFMLSRYTSDGHLDRSFGAGGTVVNGRLGLTDGIALQTDGKIVAGGELLTRSDRPENPDFVVTRYNSHGTLDKSFGTNGTVMRNLKRR